jgi:hypothetical protein
LDNVNNDIDKYNQLGIKLGDVKNTIQEQINSIDEGI